VSLVLLALLLFLLFGGSRVGDAGKELGRAVRHVKRAVADVGSPPSESSSSESSSTMIATPERPAPKLLPAKGESSANQSEGE
jgi:Sec-independent protein translocase protein TatA